MTWVQLLAFLWQCSVAPLSVFYPCAIYWRAYSPQIIRPLSWPQRVGQLEYRVRCYSPTCGVQACKANILLVRVWKRLHCGLCVCVCVSSHRLHSFPHILRTCASWSHCRCLLAAVKLEAREMCWSLMICIFLLFPVEPLWCCMCDWWAFNKLHNKHIYSILIIVCMVFLWHPLCYRLSPLVFMPHRCVILSARVHDFVLLFCVCKNNKSEFHPVFMYMYVFWWWKTLVESTQSCLCSFNRPRNWTQ